MAVALSLLLHRVFILDFAVADVFYEDGIFHDAPGHPSVAVPILDWRHSGLPLKQVCKIIAVVNPHFMGDFNCRQGCVREQGLGFVDAQRNQIIVWRKACILLEFP